MCLLGNVHPCKIPKMKTEVGWLIAFPYKIISGNGYDNRTLIDVLENKSYGLYILPVINGSEGEDFGL
jgi:hypothetical protein